MNDEHNLYWIWLSDKFGVASKEFPAFAEKFPDPYDVYRLSEEEIEQLDGVGERVKARLCDKTLEDAYSILKYCRKYKISVIGYGDDEYPARLRTIEDPPVLLYCMGKLPNMDSMLCMGMVGTRSMSEYGKATAYRMAYELSAAGVCVVSGMALGIDGVCACGALESTGVTVAVLGCGLSIAYPKEHAKLMKHIAKRGAVITEYPPFERPQGHNFPKRNRIISGLCQGVVVVEGAKGSGALITAARAISQGRELFAVPGNIGQSSSDGPNELIRSGANVALCASDIIEHYDFLYHDMINYAQLSVAKRRSALDERALRYHGVCARGGRRALAESKSADVSPTHASVEPTPSVPTEPAPEKVHTQSKIYDTLDDGTRKVYDLIPDEGQFSADAIVAQGLSSSEVIGALTMLEISGLIASMPGGTFKKI